MKRALLISALPLCCYLVISTAVLLINPPTTHAASGSANCGSHVVTCSAFRCDCSDSIGCIGYDEQGRVTQRRLCSSGDSEYGGGGGGYGIILN